MVNKRLAAGARRGAGMRWQTTLDDRTGDIGSPLGSEVRHRKREGTHNITALLFAHLRIFERNDLGGWPQAGPRECTGKLLY